MIMLALTIRLPLFSMVQTNSSMYFADAPRGKIVQMNVEKVEIF